ncbi:MAG: CotH kinase family protein, partial [Clostridia bacterium]|nr:CotH kinase family protein [Clostridia bacterium]
LPMVIMTAEEEIDTDDVPVEIVISAYGSEPLRSHARAHIRGASTLSHEKKSYKVEFTREADGRRKAVRSVPGFYAMEAVNLNPMVHDELLVREKLSWDLYESLVPHDEPFGARMTQYAEVFLNGSYRGIYLMVEPMNCAEELAKDGTRAMTDSVYRTAVLSFSRDRAYVNHPYRANTGYELYHHPAAGTEDAFKLLQPWIDLNRTKDDGDFIRKGLACVDMQSLVRFDLFIQAAAMTDNVFNNMYIIAHPQAGGVQYTFAPWDMDMTWGRKKAECGENFENWIFFPVADRMINLDAGGQLRSLVADTWAQMRASVFNIETIERKMEEYTFLLGETGAWARNAEKWNFDTYYPDLYNMIVFTELRLAVMDQAIEAIASGGEESIPFLAATQYEGKSTPIVAQ